MIVDLPGKNYTQFSLQGINLIADERSGKVKHAQRVWRGTALKGEKPISITFRSFVIFNGGGGS